MRPIAYNGTRLNVRTETAEVAGLGLAGLVQKTDKLG